MYYGYGNPMQPYFAQAKATAANMPAPSERGSYTAEMFKEDFPQFYKKETSEDATTYTSHVPDAMLNGFIEQANLTVLPSRWGSFWRYAAGLYVAHFAALYLDTYKDGTEDPALAAQAAKQTGSVQSATMGDTSISYDNTAVTAGTEKWGAWNETKYGQQYVTYARLVGMGGIWCG